VETGDGRHPTCAAILRPPKRAAQLSCWFGESYHDLSWVNAQIEAKARITLTMLLKKIDACGAFSRLATAAACVTLLSSITTREWLMSLEAHLAELERRHQAIKVAIETEKAHPGADDMKLVELKRKKLSIKDEIEKLKHDTVSLVTH
jgi:hypothetical protein